MRGRYTDKEHLVQFQVSQYFKKMEEMRAKAEKLFPDSEVIVTTN